MALKSDEQKTNSVKLAVKIPTPPKHLSKTAKGFYRIVCRFLLDNSALAEIDKLYIASFASCYERFLIAEEKLNEVDENGNPSNLIQTFKSGATNVSAWYSVMEKERKAFEGYCRVLGLHTYAREKMISFGAEQTTVDDAFMRLFKMGNS